MIEVIVGDYHYRYEDGESGKVWVGLNGYKGSLHRIHNCVVPTSMWSSLRKEAIISGYSEADFSPPEKTPEKVVRKSSKTKNSISIF